MKRGFTLIELMIAVVIIGILLAMVIPKITETIDRSRETATMGNLESLQTAITTYYGHNEEWPRGDINGFDSSDINGNTIMTGADLVAALVPDYIDVIPPALLRRGIANNGTNTIYTNEMPYLCLIHGAACTGGNGACPEHGTITNDGGWWYHVGSHTLWVNSTERDTVGGFYWDYK